MRGGILWEAGSYWWLITPVATPLTLTLKKAFSRAATLISIWTMAAAVDITGDLGSGLFPWAEVRTVIEAPPFYLDVCLRKGMESDTRCIIDLTLTSMVWSYCGMVQVMTPFSTMTPWHRIIWSSSPLVNFIASVNFYSTRCGSRRSIWSTRIRSGFSLIESSTFLSRLSLSFTRSTILAASLFISFFTTAVPTAPVAPVTMIYLSLNLFKYFNDGWYLSRNSSSSIMSCSGAAVFP